MVTDAGRDDFIIAIRSAFLKKGTRQKFSLFTLLIISILVLSLEYFKSGPIETFRSITKDIIFKEIQEQYLDLGKLQSFLPAFNPRPMQQGLPKTIEWYREYFNQGILS